MATYGTRDATQFLLPSVESNERYYTLVDADTGKITLKRISPLSFTESLDATVGTIEVSGPNAGKFVSGPGATPTETKAFAQQPQSVQIVKNKAIETTTKALVKGGVLPESAQIQANQLISPNSASNNGTQDGQGSNPTQDAENDLKDLKEGTRYKKGDFKDNLQYPANLQIKHQDVIEFNMLSYEKRSESESKEQSLGSLTERSNYTKRTIGRVILPVPGGISDTNSVNWGNDSLPAAKKALADFANTLITGGAESGANTLERQTEQASKSSTELQQGIAAYFTEQAIGASNILSRTQGAVQNPNMELLFTGPTLRPFNFTFKLSARGKSDREQIRQIIRFFKQGMAAQRTASQLFLKAPNTFKIRYLYKGDDHPYINHIKECALQSFTVNYTPEGNYMTFADGLMTSYEITMQFQELEPIFNDDYSKLPGGNSDTVIGY